MMSNREKMKRCFIVAMPGCGNYGDDLISNELVRQILTKYRGIEIGVLCGEASFERNRSENVSYFVVPRKNSMMNYFSRKRAIKDFLRSTDLMVIGGGGLLQDTHSIFNIHGYFKYLRHLPSTAKKVLYGIGVGPVHFKINHWYLRQFLPLFDYIDLRDRFSAEYMESIADVDFVCTTDLVAGANDNSENATIVNGTLGISIRPWSNISIDQAVQLIKACCLFLQVKSIYFFVFEYTSATPEEKDFSEQLIDQLSSLPLSTRLFCYGVMDPAEFNARLKEPQWAIASRYHANVLWQKLGIPCLPLAYAPKVRSLYTEHLVQIDSVEVVLKKAEQNALSRDDFKLTPLSPSHEFFDVSAFEKSNHLSLLQLAELMAISILQFVVESSSSVWLRVKKS